MRQPSARGTSLTIKPYTSLQHEILTATKETSEERDHKESLNALYLSHTGLACA